MKTPLLALLCSFALAAPAPPKDASQEAFAQYYSQTVEATVEAFRTGQPLPHLSLPKDAKVWSVYAGQIDGYAVLSAQMGYVQAGGDPSDSAAAFSAMIRHVSRKVGIDEEAAVRLYSGRTGTGPAGGRKGPAAGAVPRSALRVGLMAEMLNAKKITPELQKEISVKLDKTRQALLRALRDMGSAQSVSAVERSWLSQQYRDPKAIDDILPQVQYTPLKISEPPASPPTVLKSESIFAYLDWNKAKELAQEAWDGAKRFTGYCYAYVKKALDHVLPSGWRSQVGPASAYQFASSINRNPKLFDKLKLRKIDPGSLPDGIPPLGSIIVYGRGQCGFSAAHGHIEIVVDTDPPRACSDGCMSLTPSRLACIRKNSPKDWVNVYVPVRTPAQ